MSMRPIGRMPLRLYSSTLLTSTIQHPIRHFSSGNLRALTARSPRTRSSVLRPIPRSGGPVWPLEQYKLDHKAGRLSSNPASLKSFLDAFYVEHKDRVTEQWLRTRLPAYSLDFSDLYPLAISTWHARPIHAHHLVVASDLMSICSEMKNPLATYFLAEYAIEGGEQFEQAVRIAQKHLDELVREKQPEAMVLKARSLALLALNRSKQEEAYSLFLEVTEMEPGVGIPPREVQRNWGHAFKGLATIAKRRRVQDVYENAIAQAALIGDFPDAFEELADLQEVYSPSWLEYISKAAASGSASAAHKLGLFYLAKYVRAKHSSKKSALLTALEWFSIASDWLATAETHEKRNLENHLLSVLYVALITRQLGDFDAGLRLLKKAETERRMRLSSHGTISWYEKHWYDKSTDLLDGVDHDAVVKGEPENMRWLNLVAAGKPKV